MSGEEFVEEGLPTLKDSRELADYIYKVNRMSGVTDAFKAILNTPILPQYKIECIQWYNSYYGHPAVHNRQQFIDRPSEIYPHAGLVLDSSEVDRKIAAAHLHELRRRNELGLDEEPKKTPRAQRHAQAWSPPQIDAQTWGEWRKSTIGFGGKTRKSRSRR
jgi:hypothetical protein